jgi:hypothetical protein
MENKKRRYFRPLCKTYRPWQSPVHKSLENPVDLSRAANKKGADDTEWTAEEWDRIWRSASE